MWSAERDFQGEGVEESFRVFRNGVIRQKGKRKGGVALGFGKKGGDGERNGERLFWGRTQGSKVFWE